MPGTMKTTPSRPRGATAGFTLVELLVVITIVGMLSGLLAGGISFVQNSARRSDCLNNLRQWGGAISLYLDDHRNRTFPSYGGVSDPTAWFNVLPPYLEAGAVAAPFKDRETFPYPGDGSKSPFICPSDDGATLSEADQGTTPYSSYTMNVWVDKSDNTPPRTKRLRDSQLKFPSSFVVMTETCNGRTGGADLSTLAPEGRESAFRHNKSVNLLFADGHAANYPRSVVLDGEGDNRGGIQWNPNKDLGNQDL